MGQPSVSSKSEDHAPFGDAKRGLCLLALDGGGVRGLSSLLVLKRLMEAIDPIKPPKPCDYFDLIGGTSTGGLIAVMLGRMKLSVDQCIDVYSELAPEVFTKVRHRINLTNGETCGRFNHDALEKGVKAKLRKHKFDENALFKDSNSGDSCKTFVCATSQDTGQVVVLSSYYNERRGTDMLNVAKIWEVVRATSAATTFFEPITVNDETFIDGATGANNPVQHLWSEAADLWGVDGAHLEKDIKCLVSIGTGVPSLTAFGPSLKQVAAGLKSIATQTETEAETFRKHHRPMFQEGRAFRFNVIKGLEDVGLEEASKWSEIKAVTRAYVQSEDVHIQFRRCATNLQERGGFDKICEGVIDIAKDSLSILNDDESHPSSTDLMWLTHTRAYAKWLDSGGLLWYQMDSNAHLSNRRAVAAAASYHLSESYNCFLGLRLGLGKRISRALYYQCDVTYDGDADSDPEPVQSQKVLLSLICQALLLDCETMATLKYRISQLSLSERFVLAEQLRTEQAVTSNVLFSLLSSILKLTELPPIVALDNAHAMDGAGASIFAKSLQNVLRDAHQSSDTNPLILVSGIPGGKWASHLEDPIKVDDGTERNECLQSLYFPKWSARRDQVSGAQEGTNTWIWSHPQYLAWQEAETSVLWIEGKPGSGKSVLAKSIQRRYNPPIARTTTGLSTSSAATSPPIGKQTTVLRSTTPGSSLVADWFFSSRLGATGIAHTSLLKSILYQLLERDKSLFTFITPCYRKFPLGDSDHTWDAKTLTEIISKISSTGASIICIIDGLDESESALDSTDSTDSTQLRKHRSRPHTILHLLWELTAKVKIAKTKFIVFSRPDPHIEMDFDNIQRKTSTTYKIVLERENTADVNLVIDQGLKAIQRTLHAYDSESDNQVPVHRSAKKYRGLRVRHKTIPSSEAIALGNIRTYLENNAQGVMLWIALTLGNLQEHAFGGMTTFGDLEKQMRVIPLKLDELFEFVIRSLETRLNASELEKSRMAFILVSGSASLSFPLRLRELWDALATPTDVEQALKAEKDPIAENLISFKSWSGFRRQLRRLAGPLLEVLPAEDAADKLILEEEVIDDVGPNDFVQFMHRTVKDFFHDTKISGNFQFSEDHAKKEVKAVAERYVYVAFPKEQTSYGPPIPAAKGSDCLSNIHAFINYLETRSPLEFCFSISPKSELGVYASIDGLVYVDREEIEIPGIGLKDFAKDMLGRALHQVPYFSALRFRETQSLEDSIKMVGLGYAFYYACTNGLVIATKNLSLLCDLHSIEWSRGDQAEYIPNNGALEAAVQHDLLLEVVFLTMGQRHQPTFTATKGRGWPVGRHRDSKRLDPWILLAARSGSLSTLEYLFDHTDRYYSRHQAVVEFAVTQEQFGAVERDRRHDDTESIDDYELEDVPDYSQLLERDQNTSTFDTLFRPLVTTLQLGRAASPVDFDSSDDDSVQFNFYSVREGRLKEQAEFNHLQNQCFEFAEARKTERDSRGASDWRSVVDVEDVREAIRFVIDLEGNLDDFLAFEKACSTATPSSDITALLAKLFPEADSHEIGRKLEQNAFENFVAQKSLRKTTSLRPKKQEPGNASEAGDASSRAKNP